MNVSRGWILGLFIWGAGIVPTHAHLRNYLETYGYQTLEKGRSEVELWTDYRNPSRGENYWHHQTEVEFGITDHYTLGVYGVFKEGEGFSAIKIENRYRLKEPGEWPLDTALYFEFKDANGRKDHDELEGKLILSKDIDRWNYTANGIVAFEKEYGPADESEWELENGLVMAACYRTGGRVTPGFELFIQENKTRLIPGLYIDLFPSVRLNVGWAIGLESRADQSQIKSILELEF